MASGGESSANPDGFVHSALIYGSEEEFMEVVVNGRKNVNTAQESVMPSFGTNRNVMCYIGDIFVYLRARANDAPGPVCPGKHEDKSKAYADAESSCMGHKS